MADGIHNTGIRAPGEGERSARLGYVHQDRSSARLIYQAILDRKLEWVGLADRAAGIVDDLVLGTRERILAHQFKKSENPRPVGITALLLGQENMISKLGSAYLLLKKQFGDKRVKLRFLSNHYPSTNDRLVAGAPKSSTAEFLAAWHSNPQWRLTDWQRSKWAKVVTDLVSASGLSEAQFDEFWVSFELVLGTAAAPVLDPSEDAGKTDQITQAVPNGEDTEDTEDTEDVASAYKFQVARALVQADPSLDISELAETWHPNEERKVLLQIEGAISASQNGDAPLAKSLLQAALASGKVGEIHHSWAMASVRSALAVSDKALATSFLQFCPITSIAEGEREHRSERLLSATRFLLTGVVSRSTLSHAIPQLEAPENRLWRGIQHHIIAIGSALGAMRSGMSKPDVPICKLVESAINFLASARRVSNEDVFTDYQISEAAEILLDAIFRLVELGLEQNRESLLLIDRLIEQDAAVFRWWHSFRRMFALKMFELDNNQIAARTRLEAGLTDLQSYNPQEEVEEKAAYAAALGEIGAIDLAKSQIDALRRESLGAYLPAKKDGQYKLWTSVLSRANSPDPHGREARAQIALRLLDGMASTEGDDSARRGGRQILFEAVAANPQLALNAARWAAGTGIFSWDGILDAVLRGILQRAPSLALPILVAWSHLCLPWYEEPHGSTTDSGQFLKDLMANGETAAVPALEEEAASFIEALSQPHMKMYLLRILEEGARGRGAGQVAALAADRWKPQHSEDAGDPEHRSYGHLISLSEVSEALGSEFEYFDQKGDVGKSPNRRVTYGLRRATIRVIGNAGWSEVSVFVRDHPDLMSHYEVQLAAARVAVAANEIDEARSILASFLGNDEGGWAWPSDSRRRTTYEVRHLLGAADAFDTARRTFTSDMANARYGVGSTLWEVESIFPLLFEQVPWPLIWERLSEHLVATRDYQIGQTIPAQPFVDGEAGLLAALFAWGFTLGLPVLNVETSRGAVRLLENAHEDIFVAIVDQLLSMGGEAQMMALELLTKTTEIADLSGRFQDRLSTFLDHPDGGIVAAASFLAQSWGIPVSLSNSAMKLSRASGTRARPAGR